MVTFTVMSSGLTSASSASKAFAGNFVEAFDLSIGEGVGLTTLALGFMTLIALVNLRGVGESVKSNVLLTRGCSGRIFAGTLWTLHRCRLRSR